MRRKFAQDQAVDVLHLAAQLSGRLVIGAVAAGNVGLLLREARVLPAQVADHRAGQRIDHRGVRIAGGDHARDLLVARRLLGAFLARFDETRRQIGQLRVRQQLPAPGIGVDDAVLALVVLHQLVGGDGLLAEFGKPALQPHRGAADRFEAGVELFLEIGGGDGVGDVGRALRVFRHEADGDHEGLVDPADIESVGEGLDRAARHALFGHHDRIRAETAAAT